MLDEAIAQLAKESVSTTPVKRKKRKSRPRKTIETRFDLPDGVESPRAHRNRRLVIAFVATAAVCGAAGFAVRELRDNKAQSATVDEAPDARIGKFRKLDKDNDGRISALEAADNPKLAAAFTIADKDKDGYLSKEEFAAMNSTKPHSSSTDASSPSGDQPASKPSGDQPAQPPHK